MHVTTYLSTLLRRLLPAVLILAPMVHAQTSLDSVASTGDVVGRAAASVVSGASSPVALTGEAYLKMQAHLFTQCPAWLNTDQSWIEPSEGCIKLKLQVRPSRHATLWTGAALNYGFLPGMSTPNPLTAPSLRVFAFDSMGTRDLTLDNTISGMSLLFGETSIALKFGGVNWVQSSPLSVWGGEREIRSAETKRYAWDYMTWEDEKPTAQYYSERNKGEAIGEAANRWNKQPFKGVSLETDGLPANLAAKLLLAQSYPVDQEYARNKVNFGSHYALHGRLAWSTAHRRAGKLTAAINYLSMFYGNDVTRYPSYESWNEKFGAFWGIARQGDHLEGEGFYRNHHTLTAGLNGMLAPQTDMQLEVGAGMQDSVHVLFDSLGEHRNSRTALNSFALYGRIRDEHLAPLRLEAIYLPAKYYGYMAYGRNRAGANLSYLPKIPNGKLRITYGQQAEINPTIDTIGIPYRLNGPDFQSMLIGTYTRYAGSRMDGLYNSRGLPTYAARMGDESARTRPDPFADALTGGIRGDFQAAWETFVAYESLEQAKNDYGDTVVDGANFSNLDKKTYVSSFVPRHRKWSYRADIDFSYEVSQLFQWRRKVFAVAGLTLDGTSAAFKALSFSERDMMLWGSYFRFEPAVAITPELYLDFLYGFEWWKSDMAYMIFGVRERNYSYEHVPIDFRDQALGVGADWNVTARVGLHARYKVTYHNDVNYQDNNYLNHFGYILVKLWF